MVAKKSTIGACNELGADNRKATPSGEGPGGIKIVEDGVAGRHGAIPVRRYLPATSTADGDPVVWLHGGAFSHGGLDQLESLAPALRIAAAGHPVVAVDYRRVPPWSWLRKPKPGTLDGVRFPVPVDDVIDAFEHIRAETPDGRITLGGASAGACLAAAASLRLHREGGKTPARLVLAYGTFHAALPKVSRELRSRIRGRHGIVQFRPQTVDRMNRNFAGSLQAMSNPFAFPGGHDLTGVPITLLVDADRDSLRASGAAFAKDLARAGVPVDYEVIANATHGFLDRPGTVHFDAGMTTILRWLSVRPESKRQNHAPTRKGTSQ